MLRKSIKRLHFFHIVGKGSASLVTSLERKSSYVFIRKASRSTAALTCEAMVNMLSLVNS